MSEPLNMDTVILCAEQLKEFEAAYLTPMLASKQKVEDTFKGEFKSSTDKKKYEELEAKCVFLQNFVNSVRGTIGICGVAGSFGEDYLRTIEKFHIGKTDELFSEQKSEIERLTKKSRILFNYVSDVKA